MKSNPQEKKLTVKVEPLKKKGLFDIHFSGKMSDDSELELWGWWRFFGLAVTIFMMIVGLMVGVRGKGAVEQNKKIASDGYERLLKAADLLTAQNYEGAQRWFEGADDAFKLLDENTRFLSYQAKGYLRSNLYLDSAQKLINSGGIASQLGERMSLVLEELRLLPNHLIRLNKGQTKASITEKLHQIKTEIDAMRLEAVQLHKNLNELNRSLLPEKVQPSLKKADEYLGQMLMALNQAHDHFEGLLVLLGDRVPHRYLVLLQNQNERRATGGFIGSYALVDVNDAVVTKIELKDVYQTDGQLLDKIPAPEGINQVADHWYMRDANYSPDFPTSAQKIKWFLEKSRGPSVDTVIAIDQQVVGQLLKITGPLSTHLSSIQLNEDNFDSFLSFYVESKLSTSQTPKQILIDLIPKIKDRLFSNVDQLAVLIKTTRELIAQGHIQVYSTYPAVQELAELINADGKMVKPKEKTDFLSVISTSIGGNKSDAFVHSLFSHHTQLDEDGNLFNELVIQKSHEWSEEDFSDWKIWSRRFPSKKVSLETLKFIHGAGENKDYIRVYVPLGSELLNTEGLDMAQVNTDESLGYTVFDFFMKVSASQKKEIKLKYQLPFQLNKNDLYRFVAQRQAGAKNVNLKKSIQVDPSTKIIQNYPQVSSTAFDLYPSYQAGFDRHQIFVSAIQQIK